jgi:predicted amidohydrolase
MLFLPEASVLMGVSSAPAEAISALEGCSTELASLAKEHDIWVSVCGHQSTPGEDPRLSNVHWLFNSTGKQVAKYSKTHLFDAKAGSTVLTESSYTKAGDELVAVKNTPVGCLGLCTCYDMRFPAVSQRLRFEAGADVLAFPSAFTVPTGAAHWETLLRCRAIETQCFVVAAAQWGDHGGGRSTYGHSMIVDPWGTVIATSEDGEEQLLVADLDMSIIKSVRDGMPLDIQRRGDLHESVKVVDARE